MNEPVIIPIRREDRFRFRCHRGVSCFNDCCRALNQALSPHDVLMLRTYLKLPWHAFLENHAAVHSGPATGLPVVSLKFDRTLDRRCPFSTDEGCRIYVARPSSCRLYPLARALHRDPATGELGEHYALLQESHCRGFEQGPAMTPRQWIDDQNLAPCFAAGDALLELIALKNKLGRGPLPPAQREWVLMAMYDLDTLKQRAAAGQLVGPGAADLPPLPAKDAADDRWLEWGMVWIKRVMSSRVKTRNSEGAVKLNPER